MKSFCKEFPRMLMSGTVGPRDVVLLPSGWIFHEKVQQPSDYIGVKIGIVMKKDEKALVSIGKHLDLTGHPHTSVVKATVDALALMS